MDNIRLRIFSILCLSLCVSMINSQTVTDSEKDEFYEIPDKYIADALGLYTLLNNEFVSSTLFLLNINEYWLYTSANPTEGQKLIYGDAKSVQNSNFDKNKDTLFICHGWFGGHLNKINTNVTAAALSSAYGKNLNIIRVDWAKYANNEYTVACAAANKVGRDYGKFIKWMTTLGLSCERTQMQGQSLGSHVTGIAARTSGCRIRRITLTDSARPCWDDHPDRVQKPDATYVVGIHTSTDMGQYKPIGHADYYVNGGRAMPNCGKDYICSHLMAGQYFAASFLYPEKFYANKCGSMNDVENNTCTGEKVPMGGYDISNSYEGIYRINTSPDYFPFCYVSN